MAGQALYYGIDVYKRQYLMFKSKFATVGEPKAELANYVRLGGFPATHVQAYTQDEIYTIGRDIYNSTIFSDIVRRNQIRKIDQLERVVKYTFSNVGNTFSAKSIADYLKSERRSLDNETVYSYLDKLEKAYLLHRCSRYDLQGKEILKTQEKFYLADVALRYSVLGYNADSVASSLENIVYLELCRRGYTCLLYTSYLQAGGHRSGRHVFRHGCAQGQPRAELWHEQG